MTRNEIVIQNRRHQLLKNQMIVDSILILCTVSYLQDKIEAKLLEIDALLNDYEFEQVAIARNQVLELLSKLRREEREMDAFMKKYGKLVKEQDRYEKETLLSRVSQKGQIYLRGVPTHVKRSSGSSQV